MTEQTAGTPRTDEFLSGIPDSTKWYLFARQLEREVAALTTQRDEANTRFEDHTKAVAEWTSTAAEIIGLGEHGKVTPDQILDQLIYGRQWASDMQTKLTAAEAELDAAKRALAELVACKDLKDECDAYRLDLARRTTLIDLTQEQIDRQQLNSEEYERRRPLAWEAARAALAAKSTEQGGS